MSLFNTFLSRNKDTKYFYNTKLFINKFSIIINTRGKSGSFFDSFLRRHSLPTPTTSQSRIILLCASYVPPIWSFKNNLKKNVLETLNVFEKREQTNLFVCRVKKTSFLKQKKFSFSNSCRPLSSYPHIYLLYMGERKQENKAVSESKNPTPFQAGNRT